MPQALAALKSSHSVLCRVQVDGCEIGIGLWSRRLPHSNDVVNGHDDSFPGSSDYLDGC